MLFVDYLQSRKTVIIISSSSSNFDVFLEKWLSENKFLQQDVKKYVLNWIVEGLQDWDITRDITWGINIPVEGNDKMDKVFYGWFDNHLCYISSFIELLGNVDVAREKWNRSKIYHFIGKDIVYHHYLFLPAIRLGIDQEYKLPESHTHSWTPHASEQ